MKKTTSLFLLVTIFVLSFVTLHPTNVDAQELMTAQEFADKCYEIATEYKTLYVMGCFGAPMNSTNKSRYIEQYEYNKGANRKQKINAASSDTFGFDCVCLIKGVLWGWSGNTGKTYGGATYASNGVSDMSIDTMKSKCTDVSTDFSNIVVGEILFHKDSSGSYDHVGIYIGNGLAVESTPLWNDGVQITAVSNIGSKSGYNSRAWYSHGKLTSFLTYSPLHTCSEFDNLGVCKECNEPYDWSSTLNTADAGIYRVVNDFTSRVDAPYDAAMKATSSIKKDTKISVVGSYTNAFGNKWYKFSYNGTEGYVFNDYLVYEGNDSSSETGEYNFLFPVNNGGVNIAFLYGYTSQYNGGNTFHRGIDIYSSKDQVIYAAFAGTVTKVSNSCPCVDYPSTCTHYDSWGNCIQIKSTDGAYYGIYGHLKQNSMLVKVGDTVERGQAIASMGSSGGSYNKHLHFELRTNPGNRETSINVNPTNASQNKGLVNYSTSGYKSVQSASIAEGTYRFDNSGYKMYMIKDSAAKSTIGASNSTANTNFDFEIIKDGNYYRISPTNSTKFLNVYWTAFEDSPRDWNPSDPNYNFAVDGDEVTLWTNDTSDYSQKFTFEKYGDGYLIHPACTPGFSLTRDGSKLVVKKTTKADNQIWKLEGDCTHEYQYNYHSLRHWEECIYCDDRKTSFDHSYANNCDGNCDICGYTRTVSHQYSNSCDPTCNDCGNVRTVEHSYGSSHQYDANSHWLACVVCNTKTTSMIHSYTDSCDSQCNICNYTRVAPHNYTNSCDPICDDCNNLRTAGHTYGSSYGYDANSHWKTCTVCNTKSTSKVHSYTDSCDATCNDCSYVRTISHQYDNSCDTTCNICSYERDAAHQYSDDCDASCNVCGQTREAIHAYGDWTVTEPATCTAKGEKQKVCSVCGDVQKQEIDKTAHTLKEVAGENGNKVVCENCDYEVASSSDKPVLKQETVIIAAAIVFGMLGMGLVIGLLKKR